MTTGRLNNEFAIDGAAKFREGQGGLVRLDLTAGGAEAHVYLQGAHVTHWAPAAGRGVLWVSRRSRFEAGMPIRGGVPVCFPWFGPCESDPDLPLHGFARRMDWRVESVAQPDAEHVAVSLALTADDRTRAMWPHEFELRHTITVGPELSMALEVRNTGAAPFTFTEAFHPYFAVADIRKARVSGLQGTDFIDLRDGSRHHDDAPQVTFEQETDREYVNTQGPCVLEGGLHWRRVRIEKSGSDSTVLWNPWAAQAASMPDFGDDEWPQMLCVEPSNAATCNAVPLAPAERHTLRMTIRVSD
jgi:glucose-6-phosphate 1-epimerase